MGLKIKLVAFLLGVAFLLTVRHYLKENTFRPTYAVLWVGMSAFLLSVSLLEPLYRWIAVSVIGIQDARHIIYVACIGFLLVYVLYLTALVSRMSNQIRQLISAQAIQQAGTPPAKPAVSD